MIFYEYGMRNKEFDLGHQPMTGLMSRHDDPTGKYFDLIVYDRKLSDKEVEAYDLDLINEIRIGKDKEEGVINDNKQC